MISDQGSNACLLELSGIGVCYPKRHGLLRTNLFWALRDVSFRIFRNETVGILGRNGAGKSTLLRLLADIIAPDKGKIKRTPSITTVLLSIQAGFIASLTGRQNIIISGITLGLSKVNISKRVDEIIAFAEIDQFIDEPIATYSTGMRARLGFSIAIHVDPDILLIDETISVGDEAFRKKSSHFIKQRIKNGETTILVTHNAQLAASLCTRIIWIDEGVVRMDAAPSDAINAYLGHPTPKDQNQEKPKAASHV